MLGDGVVDREGAGVPELEDGEGGEGLGDGADAEGGVGRDGLLLLDVAVAEAQLVDGVAAGRDGEREAGDGVLLDECAGEVCEGGGPGWCGGRRCGGHALRCERSMSRRAPAVAWANWGSLTLTSSSWTGMSVRMWCLMASKRA